MLARFYGAPHRPSDTGHIAGLGAGYVATLSAFYVDNGPHLPLYDRPRVLAFYLLPPWRGAGHRPCRPARPPGSAA